MEHPPQRKLDFVSKVANGVAWRLKRWVDRRQIHSVNEEAFKYADCLATVRQSISSSRQLGCAISGRIGIIGVS